MKCKSTSNSLAFVILVLVSIFFSGCKLGYCDKIVGTDQGIGADNLNSLTYESGRITETPKDTMAIGPLPAPTCNCPNSCAASGWMGLYLVCPGKCVCCPEGTYPFCQDFIEESTSHHYRNPDTVYCHGQASCLYPSR